VATEAEDLCGTKGTREIAFRTAAIEVIKRGADRFIIVADQSKSSITGADFTAFGGLNVYSSNFQDMVVQIIKKGDPRFNDSLSARQTLGPDWQAIVAKGNPDNCL
jgi:predicted oxidoreductase